MQRFLGDDEIENDETAPGSIAEPAASEDRSDSIESEEQEEEEEEAVSQATVEEYGADANELDTASYSWEEDAESIQDAENSDHEHVFQDEVDQAGMIVTYPYLEDVIAGRGQRENRHVGNQHFRRMIREKCVEYKALPNNAEKSAVVEELMGRIKVRGRFLRRVGENKFIVMSDEEAKQKIGQSLRYEFNKFQSQIKQEQQE